MAEIHYTSNDLVKTRFVISPMSIIALSAKVLYNPHQYPLYSSWIQYAQEALDGVTLPVMEDFQRGAANCMPDLLSPYPATTAPSFEDQLQQVATFTEAEVEESVDFQRRIDPPEADLRKYERQPRLLREQVLDELQVYWQRIIEPHWAQIHTALEGDIMHRSRQLAADGYEKMIMDLDSRVTVVSGRLIVDSTKLQITFDLEGTGILLTPNIFADRTRLQIAPADVSGIKLTYTAVGSGNWRDNRSIEPSDAMNLMLGEHRARLLFELQRPVTTLELAGTLHLTTSAVSQQLKQLYQADLVSKHRIGKRVYYKLNGRGASLVEIFASKM